MLDNIYNKHIPSGFVWVNRVTIDKKYRLIHKKITFTIIF